MARVRGGAQVRAALKRAPARLREEALEEVIASSKRMHDRAMRVFDTASSYARFYHGRTGMQNISGNARRYYRRTVSRATLVGRVGLLSGAANRNAFYLRYFNDGTSNQPARPVHDDAFEAEREAYIQAQTKALASVLKRLFL